MRRFFVQNIFFLLLVNLIVKPVWIFGVDIRVQNLVGHEAYGQYQTLLNLSVIFQILLDFGLQQYNNRTVSRAPKIVKSLLPNMLVAKGFLSLIYLVVLSLVAFTLGYRGFALYLLLLLGVNQTLLSLLLFLRSNISALQHFKSDSVLSVIDRLFMILTCSLLLWIPAMRAQFTITWFVWAQLGAYLLTALIALRYCLRLADFRWKQLDVLKVWVIARQSFPYALLVFLMAIYTRTDVIFIERFHNAGAEEAGRFAAAARLLDVANNMSGVLFAGILLPLFGSMLARRQQVSGIVKLSANLLLPVAFTVAVVGFFFSTEIMQWLYHQVTDYDGQVLAALLFTFPGYCIGYIYATLLTANGSIRPLIFISLVAIFINLIGNAIFTPRFGAISAACIAVITQLVVSVMNIVVAGQLARLKIDFKWVLQFLLFIGLMVAASMLVQMLSWLLISKLIILAVIAFILMFVCRFISPKNIREFMNGQLKFGSNNS